MNTRPLNKSESARLNELNEAGIDSALLYVTATALNKSILDATAPVRDLFRKAGWHNYEEQAQGPENKRIQSAVLFDHGKQQEIEVSLYRPLTKKGDPRFWPFSFARYAAANDVYALFFHDGLLHLVNLTEDPFVSLSPVEDSLSALLNERRDGYNRNANELLGILRDLAARGPVCAVGTGDTAIGRTLEHALGIQMNSSKQPDYKGIELKSKRSTSNTRNTLFAQVPNWALSRLKSFREILDAYGYEKEGRRQLYCTVSSRKPNSQGLILDVGKDFKQLEELHRLAQKDTSVCTWELAKLHDRLLSKHRETFWVQADPIVVCGKAYFNFTEVLHTRRPSTAQFDRLLAAGEVTVDHIIKENGNSAHERGPLFKVQRGSLNELFLGAPKSYSLS